MVFNGENTLTYFLLIFLSVQIKSLKEEVSELRRENEIDFPIRIKGAAAAEDMRSKFGLLLLSCVMIFLKLSG